MTIRALVNYHVKTKEKQAFEFDVDGIIGNLVSPKLIPTEVDVQDLRDAGQTVNFFEDGITFEEHVSQVESFDSATPWSQVYDDELTALLKKSVCATEVIVFDHTIRIDDPNAERKPARNVHNDYSKQGAEKRLIDILGKEKAAEYARGNFAFVNVWRAIENEIRTSPLGFIKPSSIEAEDWINIDLIYPDRIGEILGVTANQHHEWFYLSRMTPSEVAIFNIYNNHEIPSLGHSALDVMGNSKPVYTRKSIESRTLIKF